MSIQSYQLVRQADDGGEESSVDELEAGDPESDSPRSQQSDGWQQQHLLQHQHDQQRLSPPIGGEHVSPHQHQHDARPRLLWLLLCAVVSSACTLLIRPLFVDDSSDRQLMDPYSRVLSLAEAGGDCLRGSYTEGEWWYDADAWYAYISTDKATGACDRQADAERFWNFNASEILLYNISFPLRPQLLNSSLLFVRPAVKYVWRPTRCTLQHFPYHDPLQFCRALQGRPLLFVGDSIAYQQYQSLTFMLGDAARDEQFAGGESRVCNDLLDRDLLRQLRLGCEQGSTSLVLSTGQRLNFGSHCLSRRWLGALPAGAETASNFTMIRYRRNDHVSFVSKDFWNVTGWRTDVEMPWHTALANDSIVVLNAGIHVVPEDVYRLHVSTALRRLERDWPNVSVIWRSTTHGHADCSHPLHGVPYTSRQYATLNRARPVSYRSNRAWAWAQVPRMNEIAVEELDKARLNRSSAVQRAQHSRDSSSWLLPPGSLHLLDVLPFDRLRPDAHQPADCLHYCLPGPVDTWNVVLYNILIGRAS